VSVNSNLGELSVGVIINILHILNIIVLNFIHFENT